MVEVTRNIYYIFTSRNADILPADGTPEAMGHALPPLPPLGGGGEGGRDGVCGGGDDTRQAVQAHRVRTRQQLGKGGVQVRNFYI